MAHHGIVVVGHGAAGLCAALSATETAHQRSLDVHVTILERAAEAACGGNSRWSPANIRMLAPDALEPGLVDNITLQGAIAYTFGGIATDADARVLGDDGPIRGLYAAGEITGRFYGTAPNAVAMLRALVFGRIAGRNAVEPG